MREEKLFRAIGQIDGELVEEAANYKRRRAVWWKYGTLAAGLLLLVAVGRFTDLFSVPDGNEVTPGTEMGESVADNVKEEIENVQNAEKDILDFTMNFDGMGFQGVMAYEMPKLGHPWQETDEITTLPVIENNSIYNMENLSDPHPLYGEEYDPLLGWLAEAADFFEMGEIEPTIKKDCVFVENEEIEIEVNGDMEMKIHFENGIALPDEFELSNKATREETYAVAEYLVDQYSKLLGMENPEISICDGDYTFDAQRDRNEVRVYEKGDTARETLLNYHFNYVRFVADEDLGLWLIHIVRNDMESVLGEYEIISVEEATKRLGEGKFDTTYHESEFPGVEYIRDVELMYYMSFIDDYKPYYCFWVEVPAEKQENGLNTYVAYYVPAVELAYLELTFN